MRIPLGENVTSAGWQVTLCDRIWYVSSRRMEAIVANSYTPYLGTYMYLRTVAIKHLLSHIWSI